MMEDFRIFDGELVRYTGDGGDVVIPEGVERIGEYAFCKCQNLTSVTVPYGCKYICEKAFCLCDNLEKIYLSAGIKMEYSDDEYYNMAGSKYGGIDHTVFHFSDYRNERLKIFCPVDILNLDDARVTKWAINGFMESFYSGTASELRIEGWKLYLKEYLDRYIVLMHDDAVFYRFILEHDWLSAEELEQLLENTESLECRAMILEKKMNN